MKCVCCDACACVSLSDDCCCVVKLSDLNCRVMIAVLSDLICCHVLFNSFVPPYESKASPHSVSTSFHQPLNYFFSFLFCFIFFRKLPLSLYSCIQPNRPHSLIDPLSQFFFFSFYSNQSVGAFV
ncbi:hypothetical protein CIPAW_15G186700 [Carya illinoinensis]|uniref:Uncharacterized protein n=1 Tax=Carya illinoinensis TaxID=32201 RepID=A0A8T1N978_CARIL|nr:hypothetical protein CIPAW_15G186700 [Carya illinoinensis]